MSLYDQICNDVSRKHPGCIFSAAEVQGVVEGVDCTGVPQADDEIKAAWLNAYREAPSGNGPLEFEWQDKPHRLLYDLLAALEKAWAASKPKPVAGVRVDDPPTEDEDRSAVRYVIESYGAMPFMARIQDFTKEEINAGRLKEADLEADRMNALFISKILAAARSSVRVDEDTKAALEILETCLRYDPLEPSVRSRLEVARDSLAVAAAGSPVPEEPNA